MFTKILIANRGEIACRIMRTARRLGIRTVAVYSEADAAARHVALADEAVAIGPAPAAQSYLDIHNIIRAAQRTGAEAIHPGYGFLSENPGFAEACLSADITFVGPGIEAMRSMGSKSAALAFMKNAGVPVLPGYHGDDQSADNLKTQAARIGWPVLIKASAGGGGKGMRIVRDARDFDAALASARRESAAAFDDAQVLLEKYLPASRHVEIQIFRDSLGNGVHLFERDCSVQRRHQKIIEEAPAPGMDTERRAQMGRAALDAAAAIDYLGAGTVEFIVDADGNYYFMEMNTRLQVEHPVTELVTGQDLVEWQLRVAAGERLPLTQSQLAVNGHAMEVRIYAEDAERGFLPSTGTLSHLRFPQDSSHIRVDTGVRQGDVISVHYDPMIAKLVVWDHDRAGCLRRMATALMETQIVGVTTNVDLLASIVAHPDFNAGAVDTAFIERHHDELLGGTAATDDTLLALAALAALLRRETQAQRQRAASAEPGSPWHGTGAWRMNLAATEKLQFHGAGGPVEVDAVHGGKGFELKAGEIGFHAGGELQDDGTLIARLDGRQLRATAVMHGRRLTIMHGGATLTLETADDRAGALDETGVAGAMRSPMPGKVIDVFVREGERVETGTPLLVLEAMKMEHTLRAPAPGAVRALRIRTGDMIDEGVELMVIEA